MSNQKYGGMSWGDSSLSIDSKAAGGKERFLKLVPGSNVIRVLTDPYQYYQHKYKFPGEKGFGHRIPCSAKHGACVVCAKNDKPKKRWFIGVIDRRTNTYKILDVSWSVLSDIQTYNQDSDWGDPTQYDIDIVVNPHGGPQGYYKAVAKPKKPLSASDLMLKEQVNLEYLQSKCEPALPAEVEERYQQLMNEFMNHSDDNSNSGDKLVNFNSDEEEFPDSDAPKTVGMPF